MQCVVYRFVVAFLPVKGCHFWWLIIKESNGAIADSAQGLSAVFVFSL